MIILANWTVPWVCDTSCFCWAAVVAASLGWVNRTWTVSAAQCASNLAVLLSPLEMISTGNRIKLINVSKGWKEKVSPENERALYLRIWISESDPVSRWRKEPRPRPNSAVFARTFSCLQLGVAKKLDRGGRWIELDERNYRKKMSDWESRRSQGCWGQIIGSQDSIK